MLKQQSSLVYLMVGALALVTLIGIGAYFVLASSKQSAPITSNPTQPQSTSSTQATTSPVLNQEVASKSADKSYPFVIKNYQPNDLAACIAKSRTEYAEYSKMTGSKFIEAEVKVAPKKFNSESDLKFLESVLSTNNLSFSNNEKVLTVTVPKGQEYEWVCRLKLQQDVGVVSLNIT